MAQPQESSLFDVSAYQYNAAALSCSQQLQLFGRLAQQLASPAGPHPSQHVSPWGAPFPSAQAAWQHTHCFGGAPHWGAASMPAWPQPGGLAQTPSWWTAPPCTPAPAAAPAPLALNPLSPEALASALHPDAAPCKPDAAAAAVRVTARSSSLQDNNCNGTAAAAPAVVEDEDLCDDLFRMFADDDLAVLPASEAAEVATGGAKPHLTSAQDLDSLMSQTATDQHNNHLAPAASPPPALCPPPLLAPYPVAHTPTSSATSLLPPAAAAAAAAAAPAAFYPHLFPPAGAPFPTTTSTVFSAASAFPPACRSPTPPAANANNAPSPGASSMAPRGGSATASPASSSHHRGGSSATTPRAAGATSGRRTAASPLHAVQAGAVRKPQAGSGSALAGSGRQASSPLPAAAALLEAELLAPARAPSPLGLAAAPSPVPAAGGCSDEAEGSCPLPAVAPGQQQQEEAGALLLCGPAAASAAAGVAAALDCCDNLSHTLDWMDVLNA